MGLRRIDVQLVVNTGGFRDTDTTVTEGVSETLREHGGNFIIDWAFPPADYRIAQNPDDRSWPIEGNQATYEEGQGFP